MNTIKKYNPVFEVVLTDDTSFLISESEKEKIIKSTSQFIITKTGEVFNKNFIKKIVKRIPNIKEISKEIIDFFNKETGQNYKVLNEKKLEYWLSIYSIDEIKQAIKFIKVNDYWYNKMDLLRLFDLENDYIGQLLNTKKPTQQAQEGVSSFMNRIEKWRKLQVDKKI